MTRHEAQATLGFALTIKSREYLIGKILQRFVITESFLHFSVRRALQNPAMAQTLASILCHQETKIKLLF
jgi:hypothetical protein